MDKKIEPKRHKNKWIEKERKPETKIVYVDDTKRRRDTTHSTKTLRGIRK